MNVIVDLFEPYGDWARRFLPLIEGDDAAHDGAHLARVFTVAKRIHAQEGGDLELLAVASLLHDCVQVEKDSPLRCRASRMAADKAREFLTGEWPAARVEGLAHAIEAHSFSANVPPRTMEARILRDADRIDAIGAVGIARVFYVAGRMDRALYDPIDPRAEERPLDDIAFSLDHFRTKLLGVADGCLTETGRQIARERHERLERFMVEFEEEIGLPALEPWLDEDLVAATP